MVRESRIKVIRFAGSPDLVANTAGHINAYSDFEPNGFIKSITLNENNFAGTGSMYITTSGDEHTLFGFYSGTSLNNSVFCNGSWSVLPRGYLTTTGDVSLSGTICQVGELPIWGRKIHLYISGAGVSGTGVSQKSGTELIITYI